MRLEPRTPGLRVKHLTTEPRGTLSSEEDSVLLKIYNILKLDAENGYTYNGNNWAYNIKTILDQIGMSNIWENQLNITIDYHKIKQRILDIYQQTWYSSTDNSPSLRFL